MFDKQSDGKKITSKNKKDLLSPEGKYLDDRLESIEHKIDTYLEFTKTYVDSQINMFRQNAIASSRKDKNQFSLNSFEVPDHIWAIIAIALTFALIFNN